MDPAITRTLIMGVLLLGALGLTMIFTTSDQPSTSTPPAQPGAAPEPPPSEEELRMSFLSGQADYEAHRSLLLDLSQEDVGLMAKAFGWSGEDERWSEVEPDRWQATDDRLADTPTVLADVGLEADEFARLKTFLKRFSLLKIEKTRSGDLEDTEIVFVPRKGRGASSVQRVIVWHADPAPRTRDSEFHASDGESFPVRMRETALPAEGWFVRETLADRPE